jgi:hypothetical protein
MTDRNLVSVWSVPPPTVLKTVATRNADLVQCQRSPFHGLMIERASARVAQGQCVEIALVTATKSPARCVFYANVRKCGDQ